MTAKGYDDSFGRFGIWCSADLAMPLNDANSNYIHIYGVFRYLEDGLNLNTDDNMLFTTSDVDVGTKVEFEFNKLSFGYEYISRTGDNDTSRSLGNIRYKVTEAITITGGFGENFKSDGNTMALFGIQWGLNVDANVALPKPVGM